MSVPNNAIIRRLAQLAKKWDKFAAQPELKVGVWSVAKDELDMIEAFYEVEKTEEGKTKDIILKFSSPYTSHAQYTKTLLQELDKVIKESEEDLENAGLNIQDWTPVKANNFHPGLFLKNLEAFQQFLDIDGNVVAYLSPERNNNIAAWVDWLHKLSLIGAEQVKVMLIQTDDHPVFDGVLKNQPKTFNKLIPDLNMDAAMTELAAQGNPSDPGTQFRQLYVAMMQAAGKSDLKGTKSLANRALILTRRHGMIMMEATVHLVLGGVLLSHKKTKKALVSYDTAIQVLEKEKTDPDTAKQQMVIAYLSKGMALFVNKGYELAAEVYAKAALLAKKVGNDFLAMDAWRMAGTSYAKVGYHKDAKDAYSKAVKVGMQLEAKDRRQTTMPLAAMELFLLESPKGRIALNEQMISAIGKDWQQLGDIKNHVEKTQPQ